MAPFVASQSLHLQYKCHQTRSSKINTWVIQLQSYHLIKLISPGGIPVSATVLIPSFMEIHFTSIIWLDTTYPSSQNYLLEYRGAVELIRGVNIAMIFLVGGSLVHYYYQASLEARKRLLMTANFDSLTRLVNRRRLNEVAAVAVAQFQRHHRPLSVLLCDIDHFKSINDRFGHHAGDDVLVGVAKVLMDCTRTTDSVARWGGEEFLILLTDTELNGAQVIAERIRRSIAAEPMRSEQTDIKIAMTLGVAQFTEGESFSNVVARADAALYQGKARGRNQVVLAEPPPSAGDGHSTDLARQGAKNQIQGDIAS